MSMRRRMRLAHSKKPQLVPDVLHVFTPRSSRVVVGVFHVFQILVK